MQKIKGKSWDNTKAHFSVAGNAKQMNSMNDSGEFQEVESNYSRSLSYVSSQPAVIPCSRSMLSRDIRLPRDTQNQSGVQENVFAVRFSAFDSPRDHPHGIHPCAPQRERGSVPQATGSGTLFPRDDKPNRDRIPMLTFAGRPSTMSSFMSVEFLKNSRLDSKDSKFRSCNSTYSLVLNHSWFRKYDSKNQVTTCSDFPSEAMIWIKEVEMVDSSDELKSSRSVDGKDFLDFEMLDAKIACALNNIIQNSQFKKKIRFEEQKAPKEDRFLRGRQVAFMIYDYFRVSGAHDTVLDYADFFSVTFHDDINQEFDTRWDEVLLSVSKIPSDDILESLYKVRIRESDQLKPVLDLYDMEIHHKISVRNY